MKKQKTKDMKVKIGPIEIIFGEEPKLFELTDEERKKRHQIKLPKKYQKYIEHYTYKLTYDAQDKIHVISILELGIMTHGRTRTEAIAMANEAAELYMETLIKYKRPIPKPGQPNVSIHGKNIFVLIVFEIKGLVYQLANSAHKNTFFKTIKKNGSELIIKREPSNKHDKHACAVFINKKKIGYVDRSQSQDISKRLKMGQKFQFHLLDENAIEEKYLFAMTAIGLQIN